MKNPNYKILRNIFTRFIIDYILIKPAFGCFGLLSLGGVDRSLVRSVASSPCSGDTCAYGDPHFLGFGCNGGGGLVLNSKYLYDQRFHTVLFIQCKVECVFRMVITSEICMR